MVPEVRVDSMHALQSLDSVLGSPSQSEQAFVGESDARAILPE